MLQIRIILNWIKNRLLSRDKPPAQPNLTKTNFLIPRLQTFQKLIFRLEIFKSEKILDHVSLKIS